MKDTTCEDTISSDERWRLSVCFIWTLPLVYLLLYLSPILIQGYPSTPSIVQLSRIYLFCILLLLARFFTLTPIPDTNKGSDSIRKLFTFPSAFHGMLVASGVLYPDLFKEVSILLGVGHQVASYDSTLTMGFGMVSTVCLLDTSPSPRDS